MASSQLDSLRRENALLNHFLSRVCPDALTVKRPNDPPATCPDDVNMRPLTLLPAALLAELCAQEVDMVRDNISQARQDAEEEAAVLAVTTADAEAQEAATCKDVAELLALVGLSLPATAAFSGSESSAPAKDCGEHSAAAGSLLSHAAPAFALPVPAARVEAFLEAYLARLDASVNRLSMRAHMLRVQLARHKAAARAARESGEHRCDVWMSSMALGFLP